jgi:hypothetical protein
VVAITGNYRGTDSLFGRQVVYSFGLTGMSDQLSSVKNVRYLGIIAFPLKHTTESSLTLGAEVTIDPSISIPVLPIFSYWQRYKAKNLDLYIDLPTKILVRKALSTTLWIDLASELSGNITFLDLKRSALPKALTYSTLELKSGPGVSFKFHQILLGMQGGIQNTLSSKVFERSGNISDYILKTHHQPTPFINFNVSYIRF